MSIAVTLLDHMGSDLSVVNSARVSFDKASEWDQTCCGRAYRECCGVPELVLSPRDTKLINYLARENHWSPFAHAFLSFRIKAPVFVARQLVKHQVGLSWNEVSRRYVDSEPEFYVPETWRKRAENVKQGSSDEAADPVLRSRMHGDQTIDQAFERLIYHAHELYTEMLEHDVCPEQARMVLPQSLMTEWIWSGSLMAFARVCKLRLDHTAQKETQVVAEGIATAISPLFPVSWEALMNTNGDSKCSS